MGNLMQKVAGPLWRDKKAAKLANKELLGKVKKLCDMFPMLDQETLQGVLEENEGDVEKTIEMFMPMCNSARRQEHQKRPPSGKPANRPPSASKDLTELIEWAQSDDVNVQFQAARSLADLAIAEFARDSIRTLGGIPPLIRLLSSDMIEVQRCVVTAIANLALSEENQALFAKEGEVVLVPLISIAASVCNEAEEEEMQLNVARALANMAYCNADIEQKLVELGCLSPLMTLCERGSPEVRLEAVAALANLARHEANQRKIVEHGALLHLVAAMRLPEEEELLKQAARCLANISLNIQNEKEVKESGATNALISLLPKASPEVKRLATMALANMCQYTGMQVKIVSEGALPVIFDLLQMGQEDVELQAARCMANLSQNEENKAEIVRQGVLPHFIQRARTRTQDMQILAATCLANLSTVKGVSASWG